MWQPTAGFMTHVTCRLTAKNRDQLRNPTLGNRVRATFFIPTKRRSRDQTRRVCSRRAGPAHYGASFRPADKSRSHVTNGHRPCRRAAAQRSPTVNQHFVGGRSRRLPTNRRPPRPAMHYCDDALFDALCTSYLTTANCSQ